MSSLFLGKVRSVDDPNYTNFFIEPGTVTIQITGDKFKDAVITGSKSQELYDKVEKKETHLCQTE